jgi:hypothetical protein
MFAIPAMQEAKIRRVTIPGQPEQNKIQVSMEKKLGLVVHACHSSNSRKTKIGGSQSSLPWAKSEMLSQK